MSALEQTPLANSDRRRLPRLRLDGLIQVHAGRSTGVMLDLSAGGMRIRHTGCVVRGSRIRVAFAWENARFSASAEVLASRVVFLGIDADEPTQYETRLRFRALAPSSADVLAHVIEAVNTRNLRRWVTNLQGWPPEPKQLDDTVKRAFVRCRLRDLQWERKWTRNADQPEDGFLLPANTDPMDVDSLCRTYDLVDKDGRHLIRLIAAMIVRA